MAPGPRLRPPGAVQEGVFEKLCTGCGSCVEACGVGAIRVDPDGRPIVEPAVQACVLCVDIPCSRACATGALKPVVEAWQVKIGTARVAIDRCVHLHAEDGCGRCVQACPLGARAIRLYPDAPAPDISALVCTGCGLCAAACPTEPPAIDINGDFLW